MLLTSESITEAMGILSGDDFYLPVHQELYSVIVEYFSASQPVEPVAIHAALSPPARNYLTITDLFNYTFRVVSHGSTSFYASDVRRHSQLRRVNAALFSGVSQVQRTLDPSDIASATITQLTEALGSDTENVQSAINAYDLAANYTAAKADGALIESCLATGYADLDNYLGGIRSGQLVLVAGRPGAGKSVVALDIARNVAIRQQKPVAYFSMEMNELEIGQRIMAAEADVNLSSIIKGELTDEEWRSVSRARERLDGAPLFIDTSPSMTTAAIRARAHQLKIQHSIELIIVDYLGLLRHPQEHKLESRQVMMSMISRDMKLMAKELVPVLALTQLNRAVESRHDKKPILSDLRDTGALEQDSDVVLLLHRDDATNPDSSRAGEVDLNIAKHRNGPTGVVTLANQYHFARLRDLYG
jgi:replicative DNA helicase